MDNEMKKSHAVYRLEKAKQVLNTAEHNSKKIGRKIAKAQRIREDSDYDDEFLPTVEETQEQIETARELIMLVEKYINEKINNCN